MIKIHIRKDDGNVFMLCGLDDHDPSTSWVTSGHIRATDPHDAGQLRIGETCHECAIAWLYAQAKK